MSQLPFNEAIDRFGVNESKYDTFLNEMGTYLTSGGVAVETVRSFLHRMEQTFLENGLLGAALYEDFAELTADTSAAIGDYGFVSSDADPRRNGAYVKVLDGWEYLSTNPRIFYDLLSDERRTGDGYLFPVSADLLQVGETPDDTPVIHIGEVPVLESQGDSLYGKFYDAHSRQALTADPYAVSFLQDLFEPEEVVQEDLWLVDGEELFAKIKKGDNDPVSIGYDLYENEYEREENGTLRAFDGDNPLVTSGGNATPSALFYEKQDAVYCADAEGSTEVPTDARPFVFHPYSKGASLVVVDNPWFQQGDSTLLLGRDGALYPSPENVLVVIPTYGQSLAAGSKGVPPISTENENPDYALMFEGVNIRLDGSGTGGRTPLTDFSKVVGFEPIRVVNNSSDVTDDLSKEILAIPFVQRLVKELANNNDAPMRLLGFSAAVGGTLLDMADAPHLDQTGIGLKKGSNAYANLLGAISTAKTEAEKRGWSVVVPAILFQHGEGDATNENYGTRIEQFIVDFNNDVKNVTGQQQDAVMYAMLKANHNRSGTTGLDESLRIAKTNPLYRVVGSTYPAQPASWDGDFTHRSARGYLYMGAMYAKAFYQEMKGGFRNLTVESVAQSGSKITVNFNVPTPPLRFVSNDVVLDHESKGFRVLQQEGELSISDVTIAGNSVELTLTAPPSAGELTVECAMYGHDGELTYEGIPRSNLCDSDNSFGTTSAGDGTQNWVIPFRETITI